MKRTYRGSCHCKKVRFEIDANIDHVRSCNCSVCTKRGALIHRVAHSDFRLFTPLSELRIYRWGTHTAEDYFCPQCGILPFRKPSELTPREVAEGMVPFEGWSVNARCLENLDLSQIPIVAIDGASV